MVAVTSIRKVVKTIVEYRKIFCFYNVTENMEGRDSSSWKEAPLKMLKVLLNCQCYRALLLDYFGY